jgi:hypothetical protein
MKHSSLVEKIKDVAKKGGKEFGAADAIGEFANFLGVIAEEADQTADKNLKISENNIILQKRIIIICSITLGIAVMQTVLVIVQFFK